jgi:hypothetical protein
LGIIARVGGLVVIVSAWFWAPIALRPLSFFGVRRVEVVGAKYLEPSAVVEALGLNPGASVFDNSGRLERRLESLPGIASASISRRLPGTLRVEVSEVDPVALAEGPDGLVPLSPDARPLPYDVVARPVDAPIVRSADTSLLVALREVQASDANLYADVAAARETGNELTLDMVQGNRVRLATPVDPEVVQSVSAVRRELEKNETGWRELDGRFEGWVVVRREADQRRGQLRVDSGRNSRVAKTAAPHRAATPVRSTVHRAPSTRH